MTKSPLETRAAGVLLHPTSLPGPHAVGDIGPSARRFVDFLSHAGVAWWQMLPIHPIGGGDSPYDSPSAFAGSPLLVSLEALRDDGLLQNTELAELPPAPSPHRADFELARRQRPRLLRRAFERFKSDGHHLRGEYDAFVHAASSWVWDFGLFRALKRQFDEIPWVRWPAELKGRSETALAEAHRQFEDEVSYQLFLQFCFQRQWDQLRAHARERGVWLMGDLPIYLAHDSADVWANQGMFYLDERGERLVQAGVPPDYFSADGQLWGNPLYRWDAMQAGGFGWWIDRLRRELGKFDAVRLDHFIAFHRYWEVPIASDTARSGRYVAAPGHAFFERVRAELGSLPLLAEDLGIITPEVEALREHFELPGMRILQFAFSPGAEAYLPHRHPARSVVYTGTHDNNTTRGWFESLLDHAAHRDSPDEHKRAMAEQARVELERVEAYSGVKRAGEVTWAMLRLLMASPSNVAIAPLQDLLDEGERSRMNVPGVASGNWAYRVGDDVLTSELAERVRRLLGVTERLRR